MNFFFYIFLSFSSFAKPILFGHNLSQSSAILDKGSCTIGSQALGCGISDDTTFATSPWLWTSYNMPNAFLKHSFFESSESATATNIAYFKTATYYPNFYQMEALSVWLIQTKKWNSRAASHFNFNYMYFIDETLPFSLRPEPYNDQKFQISTSVLNTVEFAAPYWLNLEFGFLSANAIYPYFHLGASVAYLGHSWSFQVGVSNSINFMPLENLYQQTQFKQVNNKSVSYIKSAYHPEIQLQYFF